VVWDEALGADDEARAISLSAPCSTVLNYLLISLEAEAIVSKSTTLTKM